MTNEELVKEFIFLRDKIKGIASHVHEEDYISAVYKLGCLHSICHEHALDYQRLVNDDKMPI